MEVAQMVARNGGVVQSVRQSWTASNPIHRPQSIQLYHALESRMNNPQENASPASERSSFFGLSPNLRYMSTRNRTRPASPREKKNGKTIGESGSRFRTDFR